MASINFPCKKCLNDCPEGAGSICCDVCGQWLHVSCSGLTRKKFKKLSDDQNFKWYCRLCIEEIFVFGKLGKIAFNDIINITSVTTLKTDLMEFTTNDFDSYCSICNKKCNKCAIPCSTCKKLTHQKCTNTNLRAFRDIQDIRKWSCPKCIENTIPLYNLTNNEIENLNLSSSFDNVNYTKEFINLSNLKSNYNFSNTFKLHDPNDLNSIQDLVNCDYYDPDEF